MSLPVVSDSMKNYLADVSRYPVLGPEEEFAVAERYYKYKRVEDAHKLVTSNLRYVVKIALEFRQYNCRVTDLVQEGNIGLMIAVKKFNPYKGFRLITYATWWIKSCIQEFIIKSHGLVKRGTKALKKKLFYRNDAPENALPAGEMNEDVAAERKSIEVDLGYDLSLDATVGDEKTTHLDMLADTVPGQEELVADHEQTAIVRKEVAGALARLNDRERLVIQKRVMADEPESLQGIGDELGVTRERVRQIESQALKKLGKALAPVTALAKLGPETLPGTA